VSSESATVTGTIELDGWDRFGTRPLAVDESGVWVATSNRVLRINPEDLQVTGELTFRASGLVVGADSVWVLADQRVTRIDPATLKTMASITLSRSVGYPSIGTPLTFGQGAVWFSAGGLSRIDATTNEAETVHSDPDCCAVIVGFVGDHILTYGLLDHGIALIDPDTRGGLKRVATTPSAVFAIEGDEDGFWAVASRSGMLYRHDLRTEAVVEPSTLSGSWTEFSAADGLPEGFGTAVTIGGDGAVWATVADPQSDWGNCTPARFDGTSWTSFAPANTGCVEFMLPAPSGGVIAAVTFPTGTDEHVTLSETHLMEFDGTAWINHTVLHDLPVVEPFNGRALDDGTVVFAANWLSAWETPDRLGLVLMTYDGDSWQVARAQAIPAGVHAGSAWKGIAIDAAGDAWFIDSGAAVQLSHDGTTQHEFGEDQGGILWISATPWSDVWTIAGPTLYRYDGTTWTAHVEGQGLTPHGIQQRGDIDPGYALGYPTQDGSFWISESTGVSVFRDGAWLALDREEAPGIPQSFGAMHAGAVVQAADGSTWVVTPSGSVHRYADGPWLRVMSGGIAFEVHTPGDVAIAPDGSAWFSTLDGIGRFVPNE
jgi:hypothetical protein